MKALKISILVLLVIALFSACAEANETEIVPEYSSDFSDDNIDLLGYEFIFSAMTHGGEYPLNPVSGATSRGDKLLARYKETEEKFNVKIKVINECDLGRFMTLYVSGLKYADIMLNMVNSLVHGRYIQNGYFIPFSDMNLDLTSGLYGTPSSLEAGNYKGDYYSIMAYYWGFPSADTMPAMWFNPRVLSEYSQTSPHELDEQGEWTWDTLEKMCEDIHDTSDPDPEKHVYALAYTSEPYLEFAALFSNGARVIEKTDEGRLKYVFNSRESIEALEFIRSLAERDLICDGGDRQNITPFVENRRAFFVEYTHLGLSDEGGQNFSYRMEDAYEWIYFPQGPSYKPGMARTAFSYWSRFFYAPINTDTGVMEVLLPFMFQPLPGETEETWQDDFKRATFFTEESFEYFKILRDEAFCDYLAYSSFTESLQPRLISMTRGNSSIAETVEALAEKMQSSLDSFYNNYLD